jgi:hypothetical protein
LVTIVFFRSNSYDPFFDGLKNGIVIEGNFTSNLEIALKDEVADESLGI